MHEETHYQRIVRWCQGRKTIAWLSFAAAVVVGIGSVTGALDTLVSAYNKYFPADIASRAQIDPREILPMPGRSHGYLYDVHAREIEALGQVADRLDHGTESVLALYENGQPLQAHASHQEIREIGAGRYSHWDDGAGHEYLFFSASDNTDPRSNGYAYRVQTPGGASLLLQADRIAAEPITNLAFRYRGTGLQLSPANSDCDGTSQISRLQLIEVSAQGEKPLYPAHSPRAEIEVQGEGRYNHCKDGTTVWLFFSTSDGKDPRSAGRHYVLTVSKD